MSRRLRGALARVSVGAAFSWPTFWVVYLLNLAAAFASVFGAQAQWWQRLLAVSAAQIAMFAVLALAALLERRVSSPSRRGVWALGWFAVAGAVRGAVVAGAFLAWGVDSGEGEWPRVITGITLGWAVLVPMSVVVGNARRYSAARVDLLASRERLDTAAQRITSKIDTMEASALEAVRAGLVEALAAAQPGMAADRLEAVVQQVVRPLSHALAEAHPVADIPVPSSPSARIGWREVIDAAATGRPFLPLSTTVLVVLLSIVSIVLELGIVATAITLPASAAMGLYLPLVIANAGLARAVRHRGLRTRVALVLGAALGLGVVAGLAANAALVLTGLSLREGDPQVLFRALVVVVPLLALPLALARGAAEQESEALASLAGIDAALARKVARMSMVQWAEQRALARSLHGPVQSAIAASALRLRGVAEPDHAVVVESVRGELLGVLDPLGAARSSVSWERGMQRVVATWEGLVDVDINDGPGVVDALRGDAVGSDIAVEIVTEAASNATRHGRASRVSVRSRLTDAGDLELQVTDDGAASLAREAGLGTRLLTDCSLAWSRHEGAGGTTVLVVLPVDVD